GHQLDRLIEEQTEAIKTVDAIDFVGYSKEHRAYLLGDMAVRDGELVTANEEDYFEFDKLRLKTTQKSIRLEIQRDAEAFRVDWLPWLWQCFGTHGMVAMTFWFGSLFAEQIRTGHKSFPFLEATGEAGAGKTTLLTFLWKLLGRSDYEGFDPAKSSKAGRARAMGQVSGMPVVLLEADRSEPDKAHSKTFEWDELKDFFGGGTLATRGVRNGGNETYEPPFRGTIVITQNAAVDASEAILTRIVKLHFKRPQVTTESRIAADNLNALQVEEVSHFLVRAIRQERAILDLFAERVKVFEAKLRAQQDLRLERVIKNHAQMLALFDCLRLVISIPDDMVEQTRLALLDMALERQKAISADHAMVNEFWEVYEYLEATGHGKAVVNHSRDAQRIAINLNHFAARAAQFSQSVPDLKVLRALLGDSRRHKFIGANVAVNSAVLKDDLTGVGTTVKCWVFAK
ncbi:bifunctional DNA primase/helicase, partial [Xanthomonas citri pv. glycines]